MCFLGLSGSVVCPAAVAAAAAAAATSRGRNRSWRVIDDLQDYIV